MTIHAKTVKITLACLLAVILISPIPYREVAQAQGVPINTGWDFQSISNYVKSFTLDGIAWHVAKIMVQQITADTVKWINSGFQGSPAFLTNPEGYFTNVGDQTTGYFISQGGPLSTLCTPFSVDVRLALALGQAGYGPRYKCTLNTVIASVENSTVNGMSIQGFMNGDFSQGGWPAFISLSEPQNNEAGAFLQAHSDLLERVAGKQSGVSQQLLQGQGFLSYPDCQDIDEESATEAVETYGANSGNTSGLTNIQSAAYQVQNAGGMVSGVGNSSSLKTSINTGVNAATGQNTSIQAKVDPTTGALTYQSCQDVTPGSFINGQLEKVAGSGIDQLNLANSINEVVSALLSQLVSQALHGGLSKVSQKSSGQTQSYIDQLSAEANSPNQYSTDSTSIQGSYGQYVNSADQTAAIYDQILGLFDGVNADFASAQACFNGLASSTSTLVDQGTVQNYLAAIQSTTTTSVAPTEASYMTKSEQAEAVAATATAQASSTANIQDVNGLQDASQTLQNFIANEVPIIQQGLTTAQADLNAATVQTSQFDASAKGYITRCQALGGTVSTMTSGQTTDDTSVGTTASSTVAASSTAAERTSSYDKWTAAESTSSYDKCVASWGEKLSARCGPSTK